MKKKDIKILLVDDEPDILEIVGYNLTAEGYNVLTAENGLQAVKKAKKYETTDFKKHKYKISANQLNYLDNSNYLNYLKNLNNLIDFHKNCQTQLNNLNNLNNSNDSSTNDMNELKYLNYLNSYFKYKIL